MISKSVGSVRSLAWAVAATAGMLAVAVPAQANVVNFDDLTNGTVVTNQYAAQDVTFSSTGGEEILVTTQSSYMSTPPNFICSGTGGGIDCTATVIFSFATPVDNLQFDALGNSTAIGSPFAEADIYQNEILTVSDLDLLVSQGNYLPDHQNLSAYSDITEVLIHDNTDPAGTGYDTLSFTPNGTSKSSVPEPSSLPMLLAGLGLIAGAFHFRRKKAQA